MATYFPYSHIIQNFCNAVCQNISKHAFVGDWSHFESEQTDTRSNTIEISEIYY